MLDYKGTFEWAKYLTEEGAQAAPVKLFNKVNIHLYPKSIHS